MKFQEKYGVAMVIFKGLKFFFSNLTFLNKTLIDFCDFLRKLPIAARTHLDPAHEHYFR